MPVMKEIIEVTDYHVCFNTGYRTLKYLLADVQELISKYGEEATLYHGRDYDGETETYVRFKRLETDEELADRLALEKDKREQAARLAKVEAAKELALYKKLKKKYEVSPDESK